MVLSCCLSEMGLISPELLMARESIPPFSFASIWLIANWIPLEKFAAQWASLAHSTISPAHCPTLKVGEPSHLEGPIWRAFWLSACPVECHARCCHPVPSSPVESHFSYSLLNTLKPEWVPASNRVPVKTCLWSQCWQVWSSALPLDSLAGCKICIYSLKLI